MKVNKRGIEKSPIVSLLGTEMQGKTGILFIRDTCSKQKRKKEICWGVKRLAKKTRGDKAKKKNELLQKTGER